jgi:PST family polysaccharide transporter
MAMVVISLIEMLGDFGFGIYLIQKETLDREDLDSTWTLQVCLAVVETICIAIVAVPAAEFFQEPRLKAVMLVLAANTLLSGFRNVATVSFQRDLRFDLEFIIRVVSKILGFVCTAVLAYKLRSYWALVAGAVVFRCTDIVMGYVLKPHFPKFAVARVREILRFSKWIYANTTFQYLVSRSPELVIGRLCGSAALGFFSVGKSFTDLVGGELLSPITRVFLPGSTKVRSDMAAFRELYLEVLSILALFGLPAGLGLSAIAKVFVPVVLGEKWIGSMPVVQILGIAVAVASIQANIDAVFIGLGTPKKTTAFQGVYLLILLPGLIALTKWQGIYGAAISYLIAGGIVAGIRFSSVASALRLEWRHIAESCARPVIASVVMYLVVSWVSSIYVFAAFNGVIKLGFLIVIGIASYISVLFGSWMLQGRPDGAEATFLRILGELIRKKALADRASLSL